MYSNQNFTALDLLVLVSILAFGLIVINLYAWLEQRQYKKKLSSRYPSCRKENKKLKDELDRKLDITERFYHN